MKNPLDHRAQPATHSERKPGAAPGLLIAPEGSPAPRIDVLISGDGKWSFEQSVSCQTLLEKKKSLQAGQWIWVDVNGLGDAHLIAEIGVIFGLHRLALEDVMNLHQHPNTTNYDEVQFTVLQVPEFTDDELDFEQVGLFLGPQFLVTFQAESASQLRGVLERFEKGAPRLMQSQVDYLFYVAIDLLVDQDFPVLDHFDAYAEELEGRILAGDHCSNSNDIHHLRREIMILRRILLGQSLVPDQLIRLSQDWLNHDTLPYFRDVKDHAIRALAMADQLREASTALFDLQRAVSGDKLNEVLKVLTIISTVFIPLTFIAGIYGMNFNPEASQLNMPELQWKYGYVYVWLLMFTSGAAMLGLFWHLGWIGRGSRKPK
ncbi:magnesium/cobalt transporter CorA [Kiritimatiellaeota bacterium B1221]|nr:magnesium/cobalt transporter CorA [Kiritimatiellaeota bacterium B1221]